MATITIGPGATTGIDLDNPYGFLSLLSPTPITNDAEFTAFFESIAANPGSISVSYSGDGTTSLSDLTITWPSGNKFLFNASFAISGGGSVIDMTFHGFSILTAGNAQIIGWTFDAPLIVHGDASLLAGSFASAFEAVEVDVSGETSALVINGGATFGDTLVGGSANDTLIGNGGNDSIIGNGGNDEVQGNQGNDVLRGMAGGDALRGGQGDDAGWGGQGNDLILGALGNDDLHGAFHNDTLSGGQGDDTLFGGQGNDLLQGRADNDVLTGGLGADTFWLTGSGAANADTIMDFSAADGDKIGLDPNFFTALAGSATVSAQAFSDHFAYDQGSGQLSYDGALIATVGVSSHPALASTDFLVLSA
jgi:Ca2+-binding RTX toxin-like protein